MSIVWAWAEVEANSDDRADEQLGTKEKFWALDPDGRQWLIKFARGAGDSVRGEDWAEWIVQHLAEQVDIPHAQILPVRFEGRRAIASLSVLRPDSTQRLVLGNGLLSEDNSSYEKETGRGNPEYTVDSIRRSLASVARPISFTGPASMSGFDVFVGYLALDAWVSGRDRHHENWAIIDETGLRTLSPSYDHGNALGFQENDAKRQRCLDDDSVFQSWLGRGTSPHFVGRPSLVDVAIEGLRLASPVGRRYWKDTFARIDLMFANSVVDAVPPDLMSAVTASFTKELLRRNLRRLHDALDSFE